MYDKTIVLLYDRNEAIDALLDVARYLRVECDGCPYTLAELGDMVADALAALAATERGK